MGESTATANAIQVNNSATTNESSSQPSSSVAHEPTADRIPAIIVSSSSRPNIFLNGDPARSRTSSMSRGQNSGPKPPVRFVVQLVPEPAIDLQRSNRDPEDGTGSTSTPSEITFNLLGDNASADDINFNHHGSDPHAQLTVRSMASIGLGSSNGRKIHLRRVHTTGADLVSPLLMPPNGDPNQATWPLSTMAMQAKASSGATRVSAVSDCSDSSSDDDSSSGSRNKKRSYRHRHRYRPNNPTAQVWGSRLEFLLASIGFATGLGNVWRFPCTAYKSGGAFLIPFCVMVFLCGIPMQILELAVGQYTREGPVEAMRNICPLFSGVGIGMVLLSMLLSSYYSVVMSWAMLYLGSSFTQQLPWTHCNNTWNSENCRVGKSEASTAKTAIEETPVNESLIDPSAETSPVSNSTPLWTTPSQDFFDRRIVQMSSDASTIGDVNWELAVCLLAAWVLTYIAIRKSVRGSGKAVYVTATMPYVLLVALMARALTLDGAHEGLQHFFHPDWSLLKHADVWVNALAQTLMSMGIAYGCLMAFGSYNQFHTAFVRDAFCLSGLNSVTSLIAGIIVFAAIGHTSFDQGLPIDRAATDGLSLSLVMYSTVVSKMPFPQFWAVFLFVTFVFLGLDTQFATVEVALLTLQRFARQCFGSEKTIVPDLVVVVMCAASFLGALPYVTQGGIYLMHLTDYYVATVALILLALVVVFSVGTLYGSRRLARNIREMTAHRASPLLVFCWAGVTPVLILSIYLFHMFDLEVLTYNHDQYVFPKWTAILGWCVLSIIMLPIPLFGALSIVRADGKSFGDKFLNAVRSPIVECPCCKRGVYGLKDTHSLSHLDDGTGADANPSFAQFAEIIYPDEANYTVTSVSSLPLHRPLALAPFVANNPPRQQGDDVPG